MFFVILAAFCLVGCGSISTNEASDYLDDGDSAATSGNGSGECTIEIECSTILNNMTSLDKAKQAIVPEDGIVLATTTVAFDDGDTVLDVLKEVTKENGIQMEFEDVAAYDGGYVEGIDNLYELDCGDGSGWEYFVNDWNPNYGCGNYVLTDGDVIVWSYTCDNGEDLD